MVYTMITMIPCVTHVQCALNGTWPMTIYIIYPIQEDCDCESDYSQQSRYLNGIIGEMSMVSNSLFSLGSQYFYSGDLWVDQLYLGETSS